MGQSLKWFWALVRENVPQALVVAAALGLIPLLGTQLKSCGNEDQVTIGEVRSDFAKDGYAVKLFKPLTLHAPVKSYLMALTPSEPALAAQEIRIYDEESGHVSSRLTFKPVVEHPSWPPAPLAFQFEITSVRDFGEDGLREIVGSYVLEDANVTVRLPVAITWDEDQNRYRLTPLLARRIPLTSLERALANVPSGQDTYRQPYTIFDQESDKKFKTFGVQSLSVIAKAKVADLVGTFPVSSPIANPTRLQVSAWALNFESSRPRVSQACFMGIPRGFSLGKARGFDPPKLLIVDAPRGADPTNVARRTWSSALEEDRRSRSGAKVRGFYLGFVSIRSECFFGE